MVSDTPYDHLLRLLSNRAIAWLRDQIRLLPAPLSPDDKVIPALALASRMAPVLSGWRGAASPLESIASERFDTALMDRISALVWRDDMDPDRLAPLLAAAKHLPDSSALWQLSRQYLALNPPRDLAERLELSDNPDAGLVAEAEELLCRPVPAEQLTNAHIDLFYRVLMQLYHFGESRPRVISAKVFGLAFENCQRFSDWAVANKNLTSLVRMLSCLRLIDPEYDVTVLLSEVIPYQRPDGSFPVRIGYSDQPQDLTEAAVPTIMAAVAFHVISHRRWHGERTSPRQMSPVHACRDQIAARIGDGLDQAAALPLGEKLSLAVSLSRATGRNGFALIKGLKGYTPTDSELRMLATRLAGFPVAALHARRTLTLTGPLQKLTETLSDDDPQAEAMRWLLTPAMQIAVPSAPDFIRAWDHVAKQGNTADFLHYCEQAAQYGLQVNSPHIRAMAIRLVQREQRAFLARPRASLSELSRRLDLMALMAQLCEPVSELAVAAA